MNATHERNKARTMSIMRSPCLLLGWMTFASSALATPFALLPSEIRLDHAAASHRVVVEAGSEGAWAGDLTAEAVFTSSDPSVAAVDPTGRITAAGNGEAVITAAIGDSKAEARVTVSGVDRPFQYSFANDIQPVLFKAGCNTGACHGAAAGKNGFRLSLRGFDHESDLNALTRQASGRRVSPAEPEESLILLKAVQAVKHGGGERFGRDSEEYRRILAWIKAGAPGASPHDKRPVGLDVFPRFATLAEAATQQVIVRVNYSDGTQEDVTHWAKFGTTDESVVIVDDEGRVQVKGPGAAAITVWYASQVSFAQVSVPRKELIESRVFADAPRAGFIDDLILKQLAALRIAPAARAGDGEFIRRAYLDAVGMLPDPGEVIRFIDDDSPGKRAELVDSLLARPEFSDYWAYKWSDLFLLSSKKLPKRQELLAFYRFIRESVAENKPWDRFAREIITAKGSSVENGAAGYYVMHKEVIDLTETTSQAFLGMALTCARCHNHPLERWTQDDYYGMASLFSRVKRKNGPGDRGTVILADTFGEIPHPRTGQPMPPKPLDGKVIDGGESDRREALADWMTSPGNPYFARTIVNRVWKNFMGRGLVEPEDDLRLINPASNEELLGALAEDLVRNKFDLSHLMRQIMNSEAYQRSSEPSDPKQPDMKYYSQYIVRRLPAEVILDAYASVTGVPTGFPGYPEGYRALQLPDSQVASYFLTSFGRPERVQTCSCERTGATSVAQTLHVSNGDTLNLKLRNEKSVISSMIMKDDGELLDELYLRALARKPRETERREALAILAQAPREGEGLNQARREAIEDLAWALLSGKEFVFNH